MTPSDLDLVIVATATPDQIVPSTAAFVADSLGVQLWRLRPRRRLRRLHLCRRRCLLDDRGRRREERARHRRRDHQPIPQPRGSLDGRHLRGWRGRRRAPGLRRLRRRTRDPGLGPRRRRLGRPSDRGQGGWKPDADDGRDLGQRRQLPVDAGQRGLPQSRAGRGRVDWAGVVQGGQDHGRCRRVHPPSGQRADHRSRQPAARLSRWKRPSSTSTSTATPRVRRFPSPWSRQPTRAVSTTATWCCCVGSAPEWPGPASCSAGDAARERRIHTAACVSSPGRRVASAEPSPSRWPRPATPRSLSRGRVDAEGGAETCKAVEAAGATSLGVAVDVGDPASVDSAFTQVEAAFGPPRGARQQRRHHPRRTPDAHERRRLAGRAPHQPRRRLPHHPSGHAQDDAGPVRPHRQRRLGIGFGRRCRPGQLLRSQGRHDRPHPGHRPGTRLPGHHRATSSPPARS